MNASHSSRRSSLIWVSPYEPFPVIIGYTTETHLIFFFTGKERWLLRDIVRRVIPFSFRWHKIEEGRRNHSLGTRPISDVVGWVTTPVLPNPPEVSPSLRTQCGTYFTSFTSVYPNYRKTCLIRFQTRGVNWYLGTCRILRFLTKCRKEERSNLWY